ncbi:DUF2501 domain-containing protein [Acetobacter orientalis]|uniref:DUF2501 domain-containing protein n=1 Tax=Acetobacter orientalis TaxID=146474 RepID=UPI0039EA83E2
MRMTKTVAALVWAAGLAGTGAAQAQSWGSIGKDALSSATSSATSGAKSAGMNMVGSMLPSLSSASTSNVAGILGYCVQNNVLQSSTSTASSVLNNLTQKPGVTSSSAYSAGQQGLLQTGDNQMFSLANLKGQLKTKLCNTVLSKAQSLL